MKTLLCSFLLLFAASALGQSQPPSASNSENAARNQLGALVAQGPPSQAAAQQNLCYTMRVYLFERNDGSSSLTGSKTCTPASHFRAMYLPTVKMQPDLARVRHCSPSGCTATEPEKQH